MVQFTSAGCCSSTPSMCSWCSVLRPERGCSLCPRYSCGPQAGLDRGITKTVRARNVTAMSLVITAVGFGAHQYSGDAIGMYPVLILGLVSPVMGWRRR